MFACRQLEAVSKETTPEAAAIEKIKEARRWIDHIRALLAGLGDERMNRPLAARCANVFTPPLDPSPRAEPLRTELRDAMAALEKMLNADSRNGRAL